MTRLSVRDIAKDAGVSEAALYKLTSPEKRYGLFIFSGIISEYTARLTTIAAGPGGGVREAGARRRPHVRPLREHPAEMSASPCCRSMFSVIRWRREIKPAHFVLRQIIAEGWYRGEIPRRGVYLWIAVFSG
jgi:hypothetical protein